MADHDSTGGSPVAFPDPLSRAFGDFAVLRGHEITTLARCAGGLGSILSLLDGDLLAQEANEQGEAYPRLSGFQRSGLLSAATVLVGALDHLTDAHMRDAPAERDARAAYFLALTTGALDRRGEA